MLERVQFVKTLQKMVFGMACRAIYNGSKRVGFKGFIDNSDKED